MGWLELSNFDIDISTYPKCKMFIDRQYYGIFADLTHSLVKDFADNKCPNVSLRAGLSVYKSILIVIGS